MSPAARQHDDADVLVVMRIAIAFGDAGDDVAVQRVALLRPVDGDPERLPALLGDDGCGVGHGTLASLLPFCCHLRQVGREVQAQTAAQRRFSASTQIARQSPCALRWPLS
ncbi:hypothetical protein ABIF36_004383 [Bradyrhizobium japonicum]